ncbi:MAG: hypothetical protein AB7V13_01930 [Pseudorhodoplanes sp.]
MTQLDVLEFLIQKGPGRTQVELAKAIHGECGYQQQVNPDCAMLKDSGRVSVRGEGGAADPLRYYPPQAAKTKPDLRIVQ